MNFLADFVEITKVNSFEFLAKYLHLQLPLVLDPDLQTLDQTASQKECARECLGRTCSTFFTRKNSQNDTQCYLGDLASNGTDTNDDVAAAVRNMTGEWSVFVDKSE